MSSGCPDCIKRRENESRWDHAAISSIRRVLDCHALGAEVMALKNPKYERLQALHALEQLSRIEARLNESFALSDHPTGESDRG